MMQPRSEMERTREMVPGQRWPHGGETGMRWRGHSRGRTFRSAGIFCFYS
ncbi:hypothetical protein LEMLEM_LOCUS22082 [Lemmus lemmus]